jgi:hypothetical protein
MAVVRSLRARENALGLAERPIVKVEEGVTYSCSRPNQGMILGERHPLAPTAKAPIRRVMSYGPLAAVMGRLH